jgi:hypothetical protein
MEDSVVISVDILLKDNLIRNLKKKLHLLWRAGLSDIILKGDHLKTISP